MTRPISVLACALAIVAASTAGAQDTLYALRGVARDSLSDAPLPGAFVILQGTAHSAVTDGRGHFSFEGLARGEYTVIVQHPALEASGLSGLQQQAAVPGADVLVASPSFATLWRVACGARRPPGDSGFVYGTVRESGTGRSLEGARVLLSWLDLRRVGATKVAQDEWTAWALTDRSGTFAICGVPLALPLYLHASFDSAASGVIEVAGRRALRADISVEVGRAARTGIVMGTATDSAGTPIAGARVLVEDAEARTDSAGRFAIVGVPAGTRQARVVSIGYAPASAVVDVPPGDTAFVMAVMASVQQLDAVRVIARTPYVQLVIRGIEERKRTGTGFFMDSTQLAAPGTVLGALAVAPRVRIKYLGNPPAPFVMFPARVQRSASGEDLCMATVFIDGRKSEQEFLKELRPHEIAVVEVYPRFMLIPTQYAAQYEGCGVVAVWTRRALR